MFIKSRNTKFVLYFWKPLYSIHYDPKKDYYKVLGLEKSASQSFIKSAYYQLALKYHPDHNKGT